MVQTDWKKFIVTFFITASLFAMGMYFSNYLSNKKIDQIKAAQDKISIDILSSETRFALLRQSSCEDLAGDSLLSGELASVGSRLEFLESKLGVQNEDVIGFKKYYSILEIKDYMLMNDVSARCGVSSHFILYFYTTKDNCSDCAKESLVLASLREKHPELRVYSFDYNLDLSAVRSLFQIYKVKETDIPAIILDSTLLTHFHGLDDLESKVQKFSTVKPKKS